MLKPMRKAWLGVLVVVLLLGPVAPHAGAGTGAAASQPPPAGLMWNKTGLPAVFPLQVKTPPGQDYVLTLIDPQTGAAALAAYIDGGAFFKVLVPPGTYGLKFATGQNWQDEEALFGPGDKTEHFELSGTLTFETRGLGIKAGHVVNLIPREDGRMAGVTVANQLICQSLRLQFAVENTSGRAAAQYRDGAGVPPRFTGEEPILSTQPRRDVQSRYCG